MAWMTTTAVFCCVSGFWPVTAVIKLQAGPSIWLKKLFKSFSRSKEIKVLQRRVMDKVHEKAGTPCLINLFRIHMYHKRSTTSHKIWGNVYGKERYWNLFSKPEYVYVCAWHHTCGTIFVLCDLVETPQQRINVGLDLSQFWFDGLQLGRLHCFHEVNRRTQSFSSINQQFYVVIKLRAQMKVMQWYSVMVPWGKAGQNKKVNFCFIKHVLNPKDGTLIFEMDQTPVQEFNKSISRTESDGVHLHAKEL